VALESTVVAHGLPRPQNVDAAKRMQAAVRAADAEPAMIGVLGGRIVVGLSDDEIGALAEDASVVKASTRDLAVVAASDRPGATTVAATAFVAAQAGIDVMATGGIGGVHRGAGHSLDISADLAELARTRIAVVCSGAKAILDLPKTLEALETLGVLLVGYGTAEFPAFYSRNSGLFLEYQVDSAEDAARLLRAQRELGLPGGILLCNPPPDQAALGRDELEILVDEAVRAAEERGITGKSVTPFLLDRIGTESAGRTLDVNLALLEDNARVAGKIAVAIAAARARG
jgi:pseudouridine-5'-phosphate glycosidase